MRNPLSEQEVFITKDLVEWITSNGKKGSSVTMLDPEYQNSTDAQNLSVITEDRDVPIPLDVAMMGAVFGSFILCLGTFGNILIIMSVMRFKPLRKASNMFVVSLALCDLFQTLMVKPLYVYTYTVGEWHFGNIACLYALFVSNLTILESILHVIAIALYRYLIIVHPAKARCFLRRRNMVLVLIFLYAFPCLAVLVPSFMKAQSEDVTFNKRIMFCSFVKLQGSRLAGVLKKVIFLSVAAAFLLFCYVSIVQQVRMSRRSLNAQGRYTSSRIRREVMLLKTVITVFFSFLLTYLPISIIYTIDTARTIPYLIYFIGVSLLWTSSSANWIIYGCVNKQYSDAYRYLLCRTYMPSYSQSNENSRDMSHKMSPVNQLQTNCLHHQHHPIHRCRCSYSSVSGSIHHNEDGLAMNDHPSIRISLKNSPFMEARTSKRCASGNCEVVMSSAQSQMSTPEEEEGPR